MADKAKFERFVSPAGRAIYPRLDRPDTKFNEEGVYTVKLAVPREEASELLGVLKEAAQKSLAAAKADPANKKKKVKQADMPWADNPDDEAEVIFSFKCKASVKSKKTGETYDMKPAIFDAKGKPSELKIGGGSILKVSAEIMPFFTALVGAGISLRLKAVQVLVHKAYERTGSSFGFETEDGYDQEAAEEATESDSEESTESSSEEKSGEELTEYTAAGEEIPF